MSNPHPNTVGLLPFRVGNSARKNSKRFQILDMQRVLKQIVVDKEAPARDLASCARAWEVFERLLRDMSGRANPKPVDMEVLSARKAKRQPSVMIVGEDPSK
jgi:hypothetical protein